MPFSISFNFSPRYRVLGTLVTMFTPQIFYKKLSYEKSFFLVLMNKVKLTFRK